MRFITGKRICLASAVLAAYAISAADRQEFRKLHVDGIPGYVCVLGEDSFEDVLPGKMPREWWISGEKPGEKRPLSRYVTNSKACSGRKALSYDFSELPPGVQAGTAPHGYTNRRLAAVDEGWCVLSFAFRCETGTLAVELRGPHVGGSPYQVFGVSLGGRAKGGEVTWTSAAGPRISAGVMRPGTWQRLTLVVPSAGEQKACVEKGSLCSYVRLDSIAPGGEWIVGKWRSAPVGDVEISGAISHFDFFGYGRARFHFDDVVWGVADAPPSSTSP